ncbi:hypothetical protein CC80DRAFT_546508 [Byssothecium circinans]|uniref:Uncharacterized protein n=1 Tax=Byssothecium circinans TaxID=147558 RepID=A0A6A5U361_9PLEO|nr:hypothetical protein CC80DRAFT_546508 [Byssothecium circinans]
MLTVSLDCAATTRTANACRSTSSPGRPNSACLDPEKQPWLYHETGQASYRASQFMATEGQTFVLVASQIITEGNLEKKLPWQPCHEDAWRWFSIIFGPDRKALCEPVSDDVEAILTASIHPSDINYAKTFIDTVWDYARPDLFSLLVLPEAAKHVTLMK